MTPARVGERPAATGPSPMTAEQVDGEVDFTRRFIPEAFTPLFHTEAYHHLTDPVRLRYNQLHGLYFNEQVAFFEQELLSPMLRALQKGPLPRELAMKLEGFLDDERRHTDMFQALNRRCAPGVYADGPYRFIQVPPPLRAFGAGLAGRPHLFPLIAWLTLLQEERALYYSKGFLSESGTLEPQFIAAHRAHLADEVGHVRVDEELLDWIWPRAGRALRFMNARLLGWMVGEFFLLPERSARRVVDQLVREFPDLDGKGLHRGLDGLRGDRSYLCTLYSREITPRVFERFDGAPEFGFIAKVLPGYRPARQGL